MSATAGATVGTVASPAVNPVLGGGVVGVPAVEGAPRAPLSLVPARRSAPPLAPYVTVLLLLLGGGLLGLLLLNTVVAQDAFTLYDLQRSTVGLQEKEQVLQQEVDRLQSPAHLAETARGLGMVPAPSPAFLRLPDGALLGAPRPAPPAPAPVAPAPPATAALGTGR